MKTYAYGFPRLGENREFKKAIEGYWNKNVSEKNMVSEIKTLENRIIKTYEKHVDLHPSGEMTLYDNILDTAMMLGVYPNENIEQYFSFCRGENALEMTKWFNTNYHYLVPVYNKNAIIAKAWKKLHKKETSKGLPYIIGGFTFLKLSKGHIKDNFEENLLSLVKPYQKIISSFNKVHIDEPAFVQGLTDKEIVVIKKFYTLLKKGIKTQIYLFTYYGSVDFLKELYDLPLKAIGLDFIHGKDNLETINKFGFPTDKTLIAGVVDGRNVWRTDIKKTLQLINMISTKANNIILSNASPLYHLPYSILKESSLPDELINMLSFAKERLFELKLINNLLSGKIKNTDWYKKINFGEDTKVKNRIYNLKEPDFNKQISYSEREKTHKKILNLPVFPTTTIGSFPQTPEARKKRKQFKTGEINKKEYKDYIKSEIKTLIKFQEKIGLDVLVHGEFERSDMVEFFAEKLNGIATTQEGWILSYGTRGYRPPIIFGDISRPEPMTTEEILYAQSLTDKPVKGMLTGPVTIIAWSYPRIDIPLKETAFQIALCLQDEINDYKKGGIKIVQIDEPAFKEKAPIKENKWEAYFNWAIKSFKLATSIAPEIQIHTHMCYSKFGNILKYILQMDFDVISIETSRSNAGITDDFKNIKFNRQIGLGVWDIHSPVVPSIDNMSLIIEKVLTTIPKENLWINPDCGLKTRKWEEIIPSLKNLVETSKIFRQNTK